MPGTDRTLIPRSTPPKSKVTAALHSPTLHHNVPIPLRGAGKPSLRIQHPYGAPGDRSLNPHVRASPAPTTLPVGVAPQVKRVNGSRIPGALKLQGRAPFGLGFALPTSTSGSKAASPRSLSTRTSRPSFHVPVIHSPASTFASTVNVEPADTSIDIRSNSGVPTEPIIPTVSPRILDAGKIPPDPISNDKPTPMRTLTAISNGSSESQYTTQSVEPTRDHYATKLRDSGPNSMIANINGQKDHTSETQKNGVNCEDEDMVLSPGFDVIQALADTTNNDDLVYNPPEISQKTPKPFSLSRDGSDVQRLAHAPPSPNTIASAVVHTSISFPSTSTQPNHRRSLLTEITVAGINNASIGFPLHKQNSNFKPSSPDPRPLPQTPGNISNIIQEVETLIGHPCVDRDAVHAAHREAGTQSRTGTTPGPVFGARLSVTTQYASCTSVLGGQTHTIPLVVFACVEELYRAGLRSPHLLRPPPHTPTTPAYMDSRPSGHLHTATHSFPTLVAAFNTPPTYGDDVDLALASLDDVGALLLTFLDCLPGGIVPVWVRGVLGDAVGIYEEGHGDGGSECAKERQRAIRAAQMTLRLLPATHFSLLVYLLAFLSQIPLYEAWNGWNVRGVARAFARVVVGVGASTGGGDVKDKEKDGTNRKHLEDDMDWVAEEEDAVEVLEWLLANWDDLSDGLFLGTRWEDVARRDSKGEKQPEGQDETEMHRAAAMRQLDPPTDTTAPDNAANIVPSSLNPSVNALLARIAFLERENAEWQRLQKQHKTELRLVLETGEQKIREAEKLLEEERNARAKNEDALLKERMACASSQTSTKDVVKAERKLWVEETHALKEAWDRLENALDMVGKERDQVGCILDGIVGRFALRTSRGSEEVR